MKKIIRYLLFTALLIGFSKSNYAKEWPVQKNHKSVEQTKSVAEGCLPASASTDLNINNVRARINTGGDMWWDLQGASEYFIPANSKQTSMFSGSLWIGGLDVNGQLKLAAQRYRGNGNDFWPGPLTTDGTASTDAETCNQYDKHFTIYRTDVEEFKAAFLAGFPAGYEVPLSIKNYPAHGDLSKNQSYYLAPFFDYDGDGTYDYTKGDYPYYDFDNTLCPANYPPGTPQPVTMEGNGILVDQVLKGDMTLWWVFNDKGNIHTETKGEAVGMEIRAQAFAFSTNDDINNMTFYTYEIINRSTYRLTETYFSQWVDPDIGYAKDDYTGCDVLRGLGYVYNGDDFDETAGGQIGYGANPPAIGVDFFQGPYMDKDLLDNPKYNPVTHENCNEAINGVNFGNGIVDDERFGMRRFVFHNNTAGGLDAITDPDVAPEYYNLLRGIWKDNTPMTYWGLGHISAGGYGPPCDFMFPDNTDPCNWGTNGVDPGAPYPDKHWNETQANNPPFDRRFMQSAGPFTLEAGAVNYITVGIPWARATSGGPWASVQLLRVVDDKCQALFDNCFKVLDGPDAPDLTIQELDKELILYLTNRRVSNNYRKSIEDYLEVDKTIISGDSAYRFEGYQIFQVKDASVSVTDIHDPDKARLAGQCDKKNTISKIINFNYSDQLSGNVPTEEVNGANAGIVHSFRIFEDLFATGDKRLVNHKQYYYIAIAYAYNNFKTYTQTNPLDFDGQKLPYKAGRKGATSKIGVVSAMPHIPSPEAGGTISNSEYGLMPQITRLEGNGNGGLVLDFTTETTDQIMASSPYFAANPTYDFDKGPLNIKVIDPLNVVAGDFTLKFIPPASGKIDSSRWILTNKTTGQSWKSDTTIAIDNEQLLLDIGLSVTITQSKAPGDLTGINNGFLEATVQYADSSKKWLSGVPDNDAYAPFNWIRSGNTADPTDVTLNDYYLSSSGGSVIGTAFDPNQNYEKVLLGTWAPYTMASKFENGPQWNNTVVSGLNGLSKLANVYSVDLCITPDRSKWTRCPVIEECEDANITLTEGNRKKCDLRAGQTDGEVGMGWFPGYAINVETGERLNMMFGEDSWLQGENGRDMIWNPTNNYVSQLGQVLFGGKHWTYIMEHNGETYNSSLNVVSDCPAYDGGAWIKDMLNLYSTSSNLFYKRCVYKDVMWVGCPIISDAKYNFTDPSNMPCEVKIRLRVSRPYKRYHSTAGISAGLDTINQNYPMYGFNTENIATVKNSALAAKGSLNLINVVPNPYYAYSGYEVNQLDNRVRVTNLPQKCTVTIYTVSGSLVRQYAKDDANSYVDWDLKNTAGIPIAGGIYLIYVKVDGVGEKVIKWFGSLRPIDLNSF